MRNTVKKHLKNGLCALLTAAMIFTGISLPELQVRAAEINTESSSDLENKETDDEELTAAEENNTKENIEEDTDAGEDQETSKKEETEEKESENAADDSETADENAENEDETQENDEEKTDIVIKKPATTEAELQTTGEEDSKEDYITDGTFSNNGSALEWADSKLGAWAFIGEYWNSVSLSESNVWSAHVDSPSEDSGEYGLAITYSADYTFGLKQAVDSLPAGTYKMTAYVKGQSGYTTTAQLFQGTVYGEEMSVAEDSWTEVTYEFEIKSEQTEYEVGVAVTSQSGAWICLDDVSLIRTGNSEGGYTLEELKDLYAQAEVLVEGKTAEDYKAGWDELTAAMTNAKALIDAESADTASITEAYTALENAMSGLVSADISITLFYYVGSTDQEVGAYYWGTDISSEAEAADWYIWAASDTWQMTAAEEYPGWYSVPLLFSNNGENAGFVVYTYANDTKTEVFKCDAWNNADIYASLLTGEAEAYAVRNGYLYQGDDVAVIQRNITLYVYDSEGTPVIMSEDEISYVDEADGTINKLTADEYDDGYNNYYYSMTADTGNDNWYYLTFSVPSAGSGSKIAALYRKNDGYAWVKDFVNGATENDWEADLTEAFAGNIYYKDGVFQASRSISLGDLRALIETAEEKIQNGQGGYTDESWNVLVSAKAAAESVAASLSDKPDNYTDDASQTPGDAAVTNAYNSLNEALSALQAAITLYYYVGVTEEEVGFYYWGDNITCTADTISTWHAWGGSDTTYKMTAVDGYPGWYSISLSFPGDGDASGFSIHKSGAPGTAVYECSKEWASQEIYAQLISGDAAAYAVKGSWCFAGDELIKALMRNVTLYVYDQNGIPAIGTINKLSYVNESDGTVNALEEAAVADGVYFYNMTEDTENEGWYYLQFSAPDTEEVSGEICKLYTCSDSAYELVKTFVSGTASEADCVDFTPVFQGAVYYKNGTFYDAMPLTLTGLQKLVDEAEKLEETDYMAGWNNFMTALTAAEELLSKVENQQYEPEDTEINTTYDNLKEAMKALVPYPQEAKTISVERVALDNDFITGADLSSYVSLKESGVVFKDSEGNPLSDSEFFEMLADGGTNWVRIRVWNDPYDGSGKGYGGGNSDLKKAVTIGQLATNAGMRVLIDFHYSDFWADPSKQDAPKAWENYTIDEKADAVKKFTLESLQTLRNNGVDVGMVQVGNETNNGICGETSWDNMAKIFNAGSDAVKAFDEDCLVAVHFADPENGYSTIAGNLDKYGVRYDVFASSYYPFWHEGDSDVGTDHLTKNLIDNLAMIAETYNKKVMVAETSWTTTWDDGDGHENSAPRTSGQDLDYAISVQGQANEVRDVVAAVNSVNDTVSGAGIGVFYWEPAWLSAYYVYNADGTVNQSLYKKNKELWEKYGSGWASSYSAEYDPTDAGLWYGGSAVDNQAWFDFDGKALETVKIYSYIRTGAESTGEKAIDYVNTRLSMEINVGEALNWDDVAKLLTITFNDGTTATGTDDDIDIIWNPDQLALISTNKTGTYTVDGTMTCTYQTGGEDSSAYKTEKYSLTLSIQVLPSGNILTNPGFENSSNSWTFSSNACSVSGEDPHGGNYGAHFWSSDIMSFTVKQEVKNLSPGIYTFGGYVQGGGAGEEDLNYAFAEVYHEDGSLKVKYEAACSLGGWLVWNNPEVTGISVSEGEYLVVGMEINSSIGGAWGTIDDLYLYGTYGINVDTIANGTVTISNLEAVSGEIVRIAATPKKGYLLEKLTVSGDGVTTAILQGSRGTASYDANTATLQFDNLDGTLDASFAMPDSIVTVGAVFTSVFGEEKVDLADEDILINGLGTVLTEGQKYIEDQTYTGQKITPAVEISYHGYKLTTADYSITYGNNKGKAAGTSTATVTLKGKGKFTGSRVITFDIVEDGRLNLSGKNAVTVTFLNYDAASKTTYSYYYTGDYIEPEVAISIPGDESVVLEKDVDYTLHYYNNNKVGTATLVVIAAADSELVKGSVTKTFKIAKCPVSELTISKPSGGTYTGSKLTPAVTVKQGNTLLQSGKDYTVSYSSNTNPGTAYVKITGKGNYTGTATTYKDSTDKISFTIKNKNIGDVDITATAGVLVYSGKDLTPKLTVKNGAKALTTKQYSIAKIVKTKDADGKSCNETVYDANSADESKRASKYAKVRDVGTYKITIAGIESKYYTGQKTITFQVVAKDHLLSNAKVDKIADKLYTGDKIELTEADLSVYFGSGSKKVYLDDTQFEIVSYSNNVNAGKASVTIEGTGDYAGTKTVTFNIKKRAIAYLSSTDETQMDAAKGYISYKFLVSDEFGTERPYTGYNQTPELKIYSTNGAKEKLLTKGVDYTISYKNNQKAGSNASITIKGKGSYSGSVTIPNVFTIKDVTLDDFVITIDPVTYSGKAIKPAIKFVYKKTGTVLDLKAGTAYTVSYKNNKNISSKVQTKTTQAGEEITSNYTGPYVVIKEKGLRAFKTDAAGKTVNCKTNDKIQINVPFTITTAAITAANVNDISVQTYKSGLVQPKVTVKVNGKTLKANTDYVVTYSNNDKRGTATAVITGIGNYAGSVEKIFIIK